jgi:hypothetical protein
MTRATSTVVDVTLFLLLVGGAAAALVDGAAVDSPPAGNPAAERAELLATNTASVEYELVVPGTEPDWLANGSARRQRTAHGTLAELLGEVTMSRVRIDGQRISPAGRAFESAVTETTKRRLRDRRRQTSVRVEWEPYPGAPVSSTLTLGTAPPASADVRAATISVASGVEDTTNSARSAAQSRGYRGVASVVAREIVDGLFPPDRTRVTLHGDYPGDAIVAQRYQRTGTLSGAGDFAVESTPVTEMNRELTVALRAKLTDDMRSQFASPRTAAAAVDTQTVHITVRTWSP